MRKHLSRRIDNWANSILDVDVANAIRKDAVITGGAIVSLLLGESPNDYDVYFKSFHTTYKVAKYYADKWNKDHSSSEVLIIVEDNYKSVDCCVVEQALREDNPMPLGLSGMPLRVTAFIQSRGVVSDGSAVDDPSEPVEPILNDDSISYPSTEPEGENTQTLINASGVNPQVAEDKQAEQDAGTYRPRYISSNAMSLTDKLQVVLRFYGPVDKIHENYDYEHCKGVYDYSKNEVTVSVDTLECILNKELRYNGSKYPLCSIIRSRKFIERGWKINAGQYLKMCLDLNELNLRDFNVFRDQITGVDSHYFTQVIDGIKKRKEEDETFNPDNYYLFEVINKIFN
jgi:hypothetical protein